MNELLTKYGISELKLACTLRKDEIAFKVPFNHNVCIYSSFMHEIWAFRETEREGEKAHANEDSQAQTILHIAHDA